MRETDTMALIDPPAPGAPDESDVRAGLERVLASNAFRASPQLGAFLRYVVGESLGGRGAGLKGYTIGVEALGRDPRFNPQIDPIVRVEATRLRRALERYYADDGSGDPVVITLQRGSYAPMFSWRTAASPPLAPADAGAWGSARALLAVLFFGALIALAGLIALPRHGRASHDQSPATTGALETQAASRLPPGNGMPTIYIEPLRITGTPRPDQIAAASLADEIRDAFARFDTINVASEPRPSADAGYRLAGSVEYGETATTMRFQLIDTAANTIAWSRSFDYPAAAADQDAAEDAIVVELTNTLLQSYGVIRARDRTHQLAAPGGDPRYRCVLEAADSLRFPDRSLHEAARTCLERLTTLDPSFAVGFEYLALIYYREDALEPPSRPGDAPALERALRAARHAIELAPASGRAYQDLFVVLYARHDVAAAFAAADKAIALNQYDLITLAEYGGRLVMTGEVERGLEMLRRAAAHSGGVLPAWQHYYLFLGNYLAGDLKQAAFHAGQITTDDYPLGLVARAIAAHRGGHGDEAHRLIDRLVEVQPAWRTDARRLLEKSIYVPQSVDRILHDLADAGLTGVS
jgi:tetratricopeptide (TPR) repeat protein